MPDYTYNALDDRGAPVSGRVAAPGRAEAIAQLAARKVYVTDLDAPDGEASAGQAASPLSWRRKLSPRLRASMLQQLATALKAGLPLLSALRVIEQQSDSRAAGRLARSLADDVQAGQSLSEAMAARPREFKPLEVSMVRVGETAGVLDDVMNYLADFAERDVEVRNQIRSAATYPVFVLSLAAVSVVVIVAVILPRVMGAVTDEVTAAALPLPTRMLLALSAALRHYGWAMALGAAGALAGFRAWVARPEGRYALDRFKLRIPVLGGAIRKIAVARFARTLGTLSKSGIQILEALDVLRGTLGNEALARRIDEVSAQITRGESIAEPLRQTGDFPPLLIQVIAMGERTGRLDELLLQTASAYEKDTAAAIGRVMTLLPGVLIVLLALVVVFILSGVLLPIIEMQTALPGM
ncbi:MAG: type II secretion system F family protein [Planctomycetes bacterium]|nr:type II secretion system F family protein [Planctomycetota bacterium]